jgi:hypothetical protein
MLKSTTPGQSNNATAAGAAMTDNSRPAMPAANGSTY